MGTFAGKTVVISGASEGIGRALALRLAHEHARLVLVGRNAARLEEAVAECRRLGTEALAVSADVSHQEDCRAVVARAIERFDTIDALVNNAGITLWARFDALTDLAPLEKLLAVNYLGSVYLTAAALPHLRRTRGLIVAVASIAGLTGVPERTGYAASKHAMVGFFESLRIELRGTGVDVTIIAPDFVVSALHRRAIGPDGRPLGVTPMQESRIMTAERCAQLIAKAMERRSRLLVTSFRGRLARWARLLVPALVDRLAQRAIRERR
jgi:short-subunit dehydrogenase